MKKNKRLSTLLKYLLEQKEPVSIRALSEMLTVSKRTIRYDLDEIEDLIKDSEFELKRKPNFGIYLEGDRDSSADLYYKFDDFYNSRHFRSAEKRKYIILYRLFQKKEAILMRELADFLDVSTTTVSKDLNMVEDWLEDQNLRLLRKRNYGIEIEGNELQIRQAMKVLINQTYENGEMIDLLNEINEREDYRGRLEYGFSREIAGLVGEEKLKKLEKIIRKAEKELELKFADAAYAGLVFHIAFALSRLKSNKDIKIEADQLESLKGKEEFNISEKIAKMLEEEFSVKIPDDEIGFITLHLLGARMREREVDNKRTNLTKLEVLVAQIIEIVGNYFNIDLTQDDKLYNGMLIHLKAALNRLLFDLPIDNPLVDDIKERYGEIFTATSQAARIIQNEYYIEISEEEIAYLTIHFGAALERLNYPLKRTAEVIIVCSSGVGTTNLLEVRLKNEFKGIKIKDSLSTYEAREKINSYHDIDFIISTIPFKCEKKDVVVVKPFLDEDDINKIKDYLKSKQIAYGIFREEENTSQAGDDIKRITKLLKPYIKDDKVEKVKTLIEEYFNSDNLSLEKSERQKSGLLKFLKADFIRVNEQEMDWKDALDYSGQILVEKNLIDVHYVNRMIEIVEEKGPYIAIAPHICLAHAGLEDGVNKASISLAVFKNGFKLKHDFDPIKFVFVLAPEDKKSHLPALTDIMKIANNKEIMNKILESENNIEIYEIIKKFLNSY